MLDLAESLNIDTQVQAANLPKSYMNFANSNATVSGWGYTEEGSGDTSDTLRQVLLPVVSDEGVLLHVTYTTIPPIILPISPIFSLPLAFAKKSLPDCLRRRVDSGGRGLLHLRWRGRREGTMHGKLFQEEGGKSQTRG